LEGHSGLGWPRGFGWLQRNFERHLAAQRHEVLPRIGARNVAGVAAGKIVLPEMVTLWFLPGQPQSFRATAGGFQLIEFLGELAGLAEEGIGSRRAQLLSENGGDCLDPDKRQLEILELRRHKPCPFGRTVLILVDWVYLLASSRCESSAPI